MKKSIKTALLFSTLIIGAVETPNVINQTSGSAQFVAHADSTVDNSSTSNIKKLDPEIQQILLQNVNQNEFKNYGSADQITNGDLANLQSINYTASGSESIKTLDNINPDIFPSLTSISISNVDMSSVKDLSPLAQLTNLNTINLTGANITSDQLSTLGQWSDSSLNNLDLSNNNISSLDFLKDISIPNVENINISHNKVSDFTPVKSQKWLQLATLKADFNNISDISPIADVNWPNLTVLSVKNNQISDISPISSANWPNLDQLYADNNNISDINSFANTNWHKLSTISANGNHISNVASLKDKKAQFPNLTKFYVSNNNINDISWMSGYNFDSSSNAKQEIINATANVVKTTDGKPVTIKLPISINDISLDNSLLASPDSNGQNIIVDNNYVNNGVNYNENGTLVNTDQLVGNDGKAYTINNDNGKQTSNGLAGINLNSGTGSTKYTFGFTSTLGQGYTGYFYGAYNLTVNWGENTTQSKDVNVTVKYVDQNGKEISTPQTKKISFTETGFKPDDTAQQITWNNDWKDVDGTSYSFTSPNINGYEDPSEVQVSGTVDHDSTDIVKTVTYKTIPVSSSASSSSSDSQSASSADSQSQSSASSSTSSAAQSSSASSQQASSSSAAKEANSSSSEPQSSSAAKEANNSSSEPQTSSAAKASSETQSSSAAKEANSSSSQSQRSSAAKETNSSSSEPQSSSVAKEVSSSSSESQSSSATKEASSSAQSIPASNQSTASSSSSVSSSSSSTNESSATPTTPSKSAVVAPKHSKSRTPKHSNNNGTPKTDNVQSKQVTAKKVETPSSSEHKNAKSLPQTGDSTNQNALVALGSVLVAISATMIAFVLRRKNK
ncbi:leucine-rich repeat domain-containing protein [Apilactobacillus sp. 1-1-2]|uniref:leucine-rich repeat domain-containing protein n=1 Tax=Apilactobacillus sp. 1-1-2 TaxID=3411035 RepID=UPI003B95727C